MPTIWRTDSVTGNDANAGTPAAPWATFGKAVAKINDNTIVAGDVVEVMRGSTFNENSLFIDKRPASAIYIVAAGTGAIPIINAQNLGYGLKIKGDHFHLDSIEIKQAVGDILALEACNFVTARRLLLHHATNYGCVITSKDGSGNGHDNVVEYCEIRDTDDDGLNTGNSTNTIRFNLIHDCAMTTDRPNCDGIGCHGVIDAFTDIYGNVIYNVRGKSGIGANLLGGNLGSKLLVHENWVKNIIPAPSAVGTGGQAILSLGTASIVKASNNVLILGANTTLPQGGLVCQEGTMYGWHNVIYNEAAVGGVVSMTVSAGATAEFKNNVSYCSTSKGVHSQQFPGATGTWGTNQYFPDNTTADLPNGRFTDGTNYALLAAWQAAGLDAGSFAADPLFAGDPRTNAAGAKLTTRSPGRGKATNLSPNATVDAFGSTRTVPWDIGCHQYVGDDGSTLDGKKLRITSKAIPSQVVVVQDGNAADGTATIKIDDGFRDGYDSGLAPADSLARVVFDVERLTCSRDGKSLAFTVQDHLNRNSLALGNGDLVEFWVQQGEALPPVSGTWPSWHSALQDGQVKHFTGYIKKFNRVQRSGGYSKFRAECVDALSYANSIKLCQSKADGITIQHVVFNVDKLEDADWFFSIKKYDAASGDPVVKFGYGNPKDVAASKMTLQEIFQYLQAAYRSDLFDRKLIAGAGDDIFDSTDLSAFSGITPPKMVFERTGFGDAVRQLIRANALDFDVVVDPRTRKWRFLQTGRDMVAGTFGTVASVQIAKKKWRLNSVAGFATSGTGSSVRLQSATDPRASEVRRVIAVDAGLKDITVDVETSYAFAAGDFLLPMYAESARPPFLQLDLEKDCEENELTVDLQGVYTAVSIVGRHQKSETKQIGFTSDAQFAVRLKKAYDSAYEANYRPELHLHRKTDRGIDGQGIVIYERETVNPGPSQFTRLYFSELSSQYGNDHDVVNNSTGESEWKGTAFHLLTTAAGTTNVTAQNVTAIINKFYRSGWVDGPANTIRRFAMDLDRDVLVQAPNLKAQLTDSTTGDRFEITASEIYKPANPNKRWSVGRHFSIESTTVDNTGRFVNTDGCPATVQFQGLNDQVLEHTAVPAERAYEQPENMGQLFNNIGGATIPAPQRIFFLHPPDPSQAAAQACAQAPAPAFVLRDFTMSITYVKQEVLQARTPAAGFMGLAKLWHNHTEELQILSDSFVHESQAPQFSLLSSALWSRVSEPHYEGPLSLVGLPRWLRMADLGFRVGFGAGDTGIILGAVTEQARFWGLVETIDFDFAAGKTSLSFNSNGIAETFAAQELIERLFVSETAEMKELKDRQERTERQANCLATRPRPRPPQVTPSCNVAHQGQSVSSKVTRIDPKEAGSGLGETSLGAPMPGGSSSGNTGSTAFHPAWAVERGYDGRAFGIAVPSGAVYGGTETTNRFVPDGGVAAAFVSLPQFTAEALDEMVRGFTGADMQTPDGVLVVDVGTGSDATVIQIANAVPNDGRFVGGTLEFRMTNGVTRPKYTIASHTAKAITLTSAMAESVPPEGSTAWIWPARIPLLDATDFPASGRAWKDTSGQWFVATGGTMFAAEIVGGVLKKDVTSPPDAQIRMGFTNADVTAAGDWTFGNVLAGAGPQVSIMSRLSLGI